jgi:hypothetical protein
MAACLLTGVNGVSIPEVLGMRVRDEVRPPEQGEALGLTLLGLS